MDNLILYEGSGTVYHQLQQALNSHVINKTEAAVSSKSGDPGGPLEETLVPEATVMAADQYVGCRVMSAGPTV
jgi:hypothetical protein